MPRLWNDTIEAHRHAVRDATLDATAMLVAQHGLRGVTMSRIAEATGIGRATLYRYFPDVEAILTGWHERQMAGHLAHLATVRARPGEPLERLRAVLKAYALATHRSRQHHGLELVAFLHRDSQVVNAQRKVHEMVRDLITECVRAGELRDDVAADEMASYSLHAVAAADAQGADAAINRLLSVMLDGLRRR